MNNNTSTTPSRYAFLRVESICESLGLSQDFADQCATGIDQCVALFKSSSKDRMIAQPNVLELMINVTKPATIVEALYAGYCAGMLFQKFMYQNEQIDKMNGVAKFLDMLAKGQDSEE